MTGDSPATNGSGSQTSTSAPSAAGARPGSPAASPRRAPARPAPGLWCRRRSARSAARRARPCRRGYARVRAPRPSSFQSCRVPPFVVWCVSGVWRSMRRSSIAHEGPGSNPVGSERTCMARPSAAAISRTASSGTCRPARHVTVSQPGGDQTGQPAVVVGLHLPETGLAQDHREQVVEDAEARHVGEQHAGRADGSDHAVVSVSGGQEHACRHVALLVELRLDECGDETLLVAEVVRDRRRWFTGLAPHGVEREGVEPTFAQDRPGAAHELASHGRQTVERVRTQNGRPGGRCPALRGRLTPGAGHRPCRRPPRRVWRASESTMSSSSR